MKRFLIAGLAVAALVFGNAAPAHAQASGTPESLVAPAPADDGVTNASETYGTAATSYVIGAYDFEPFSSASTFGGQVGTGDRFFTSAGGFFLAPLNVPNGAALIRMEIQGCDTNAGPNLVATLFSNTTIGGTQSEMSHGSASSTGTPGCGFFSANLAATTITNQTRTYYVQVTTGATDNTVRFSAVRVFYRVQVSPGPGTATFPNDVPTSHPFFPFIEALAASGVTGGCGPLSYCPDAAVTRGQMAVFLATALGLHFPN